MFPPEQDRYRWTPPSFILARKFSRVPWFETINFQLIRGRNTGNNWDFSIILKTPIQIANGQYYSGHYFNSHHIFITARGTKEAKRGTITVLATGQSVRPEGGRRWTALCCPVRPFSKLALRPGAKDYKPRRPPPSSMKHASCQATHPN